MQETRRLHFQWKQYKMFNVIQDVKMFHFERERGGGGIKALI